MATKTLSTNTCKSKGHPEFILVFDEPPVPVHWADWLKGFIEERVQAGEVFKADESFQIGWMLTRIMESDIEGFLTICEPDFSTMPVNWVTSVTRSLLDLNLQGFVAESVGLTSELDFPSYTDTGVICNNFFESETFYLMRSPKSEKNDADSGWFLSCTDEEHNHDSTETLSVASLYECGLRNPSVVPYLALPVGVTVLDNRPEDFRLVMNDTPLTIAPGSYLEMMANMQEPE